MYLYEWVVENKEFLKIFYALVIGLICAIITIESHRLFKLSFHQGIRYFRNAFLFYGLAFVTRYLVGNVFLYMGIKEYCFITRIAFEFFLIMAGFFLLYSLLWKRFEGEKNYRSSLFNLPIMIFYLMTIIIINLDYTWNKYAFMFFSQFVIFSIASLISYNNYIKNKGKHKFLKFYFLAIVLSFIGWLLNFLLVIWIGWSQGILMNIYGLNIIIFLLFLYGVIKITRRK